MAPSPETSDESLACLAQAGDASAFEALVIRHHPRLVRFIAARLRDVRAAEDIVQDALVNAWHALHRWDARRPFLPWIFAICRNRLVDHIRRTPPSSMEDTHELAHNQTPALSFAMREDAQRLWQWAQTILNERQYTTLWLHYQEEFSVAETATAMRLTTTHVKVLLHRARSILARALKQQPEWHDCLASLAISSVPVSVRATPPGGI